MTKTFFSDPSKYKSKEWSQKLARVLLEAAKEAPWHQILVTERKGQQKNNRIKFNDKKVFLEDKEAILKWFLPRTADVAQW